MNCDLVFEILTRGPFPAGQPTDASVELHLRSCYECRQLAEALRPATTLIHEAIDEPDDSLPGYRGELPVMAARPTAVAAAVEAAIAEIAQETDKKKHRLPVEVVVRRKRGWHKRRFAMLPFSLAMLAASIVAATLVGMQFGGAGDPPPVQPLAGPQPEKPSVEATLAGLPSVCVYDGDENAAALAATQVSQCCLCHIQAGGTASSMLLAEHSVALCLTCHTN